MRLSVLRACRELNPKGIWPLDLDAILADQGIQRRFESAGRRSGVAYLEVGQQPVITIIKKGGEESTLSPRDRFSVAHELAHWVLWKQLAIPPAETTSEYWKHEALCDQFAQNLLIPPKTLKQYVLSDCTELPPVAFPQAIARAAHVTWQAAARAISSIPHFDLAYLRLKPSCAPKEVRLTYPFNPKREFLLASEGASPLTNTFYVDHSSLSFRQGAFAGQNSCIQDECLFEELRRISEVMTSGAGSVYRIFLTLSFGSVRLRNVACLVMRRGKSWIICFRRSDPGIVEKRSTNKEEWETQVHRFCSKSEASKYSWLGDDSPFGNLPPQETFLRPVQKLAIDSLKSRSCLSEAEFTLMLANQFAKVNVKHLTKLEGDSVIKLLEKIVVKPHFHI